MNSRIIPLLIAISLCISVALYHQGKAKRKHDIDKIKTGIAAILPRTAKPGTISFAGEPSRSELYLWARYVLAPAYIAYAGDDTLLSVQYLHAGDSALNRFLGSRKKIYEYKDDQYRYLLTVKHTAE